MQLAQRHDDSAETMNELRALNARFIHNFVTGDVASHDAILHPAFINIWPTGQRWHRATYLKYWATAFDPRVIVYWDVRDELITVIGDVALVRATNKHTRRRDGQEVTGMTMYTDTYLFEHGAWKCIQAQLTPVAAAEWRSAICTATSRKMRATRTWYCCTTKRYRNAALAAGPWAR